MSLPFTNADVVRAHHLNVRFYQARNRIRWYMCNLMDSTKNAAKLLYASVTSCIHGVCPSMYKYTPLSVCLSIVENDLTHNNNIPMQVKKTDGCAHAHIV